MTATAIDACPGCNATARDAFAFTGVPLWRCSSCGLVHARDYLPPDELYVDGYLSGGTGSFGVDLTHPSFQQFLVRVNRRRMRFLGRVTRPPGLLLDVGCGSGELLLQARATGWDTVGVDLVPDAVKAAVGHGLDVRESLLQDSGLPERSFDVVCATHVLEHQVDAVAFVRMLSRWVRPGGHLFLEVPNWHSMNRRGLGPGWPSLRPQEHLSHFEPRTLASTLRTAEVDVVRLRSVTYLDEGQTLDDALADLGLVHRRRWFAPLARGDHRREGGAARPGPALFTGLRGLAASFDRAGVGATLVAISRVY
jgi:SAM-dependent methyltransferase